MIDELVLTVTQALLDSEADVYAQKAESVSPARKDICEGPQLLWSVL